MTREQLLKLCAVSDQDRAQADEWMRESSLADLARVWEKIQQEYPNPLLEVMSRFAQIAFTESVMRVFGEEAKP